MGHSTTAVDRRPPLEVSASLSDAGQNLAHRKVKLARNDDLLLGGPPGDHAEASRKRGRNNTSCLILFAQIEINRVPRSRSNGKWSKVIF